MKINVSNERLLQMDMELIQLQSSVLYFFMNGKINKFYQDNGIRITTIKEKRKELYEKYLLMEDGMIKMDDENKKPLFKDGVNEPEFFEKNKELMSKENVLEI